MSIDELSEDDVLHSSGEEYLGVSEADESLVAWESDDWAEESSLNVIASVETKSSSHKKDRDCSPEEVLHRYWGYEAFRPLQREIVQSVLDGYDTMALLPTGGGKSVCFQVPGLMREGITLVITPLISLMKDQVDHLRRQGIKAAAVHSGMTGDQIRQTLDNCLYGSYKFLYVSPERLASERFRRHLSELSVGLLVVDECHCICQWGYDFRPSYLHILELRELLPDIPLIALTATATPEVATEIRRILGFDEGAKFFQKSFYRENISYAIRYSNDKYGMLAHILSRVAGSVIVYCRNRELCRDLAKYIRNELGEEATFFHAGLTYAEREIRQNRWMSGECRIMVATNAFGMGIDKPDVRLVIHWTLPSSVEEYFQEAGRAGRDGQLSYAVAIVADQDEGLVKRRYSDAFPEVPYIKHCYEMLCNYLGVGEGEGFNHSYSFDLRHFIQTCRMRPAQTKPAIDIMALSGWLEYKEDDSNSRVMVVCRREDLYREHVGHDELLRALLRRYTGLFADYVFISETELAMLTGYTQQEVYGMLTALDRKGLLHYIPKKNIPRIVFRIRREDSCYLRLSPKAYQERRERMQERIGAMLGYMQREGGCRSKRLLAYFGEEMQEACGKCDICLARPVEGLRQYIIEDCASLLRGLRAEGRESLSLVDFVRSLRHSESDALTALQYLSVEDMREEMRLLGDLIIFVGMSSKGNVQE